MKSLAETETLLTQWRRARGAHATTNPSKLASLDTMKLAERHNVFILQGSSEIAFREVSMARPAQDVTDAELAVLEVLWKEGTVTVRTITDRLYPNSQGSQHATVQKLLDRLKSKSFVKRDRSVWPHVFQATVDREELIGRRLRKTAERLCGGSLNPLLTHLIRDTGLSKAERDDLRELLDNLDRSRQP